MEQRIAITIEPGVTAAKQLELIYRLLILAQLSGSNSKPWKERDPLEITNERDFTKKFNEINPQLNFTVPNRLTDEGEIEVKLDFKDMKDFLPDSIVQQVAPLKEILQVRKQLENAKRLMRQNTTLRDLLSDVLKDKEGGTLAALKSKLDIDEAPQPSDS